MITEIYEIPEKAELCYRNNRSIRLPEHVPYIGMGSSYFAPLALKYLGCDIFPEIASEYYHYSKNKILPLAILISQSGYSSETVWNIEKFSEYIALVNDTGSPLARSGKLKYTVELHAGIENYSSTKTYVNTLISLYQGLGNDCYAAIEAIRKNMARYEDWGEKQAGIILAEYRKGYIKGSYILGNGPNIATACEAALILTETTKIPFIPMAMAQYDHGPKESAENTIVLTINTCGPVKERTNKLLNTISRAGAISLVWDELSVQEYLSPITSIIPFNFLANAIAGRLGIKDTFSVGNKVTTVDPPERK